MARLLLFIFPNDGSPPGTPDREKPKKPPLLKRLGRTTIGDSLTNYPGHRT
jgi:hypothetical protein